MIRIEDSKTINFSGQMSVGYLRCHGCGFKNAYHSDRFVFNGCPKCGNSISLYIGECPDWLTEEDPASNPPQPNILARVASRFRAALERKP